MSQIFGSIKKEYKFPYKQKEISEALTSTIDDLDNIEYEVLFDYRLILKSTKTFKLNFWSSHPIYTCDVFLDETSDFTKVNFKIFSNIGVEIISIFAFISGLFLISVSIPALLDSFKDPVFGSIFRSFFAGSVVTGIILIITSLIEYIKFYKYKQAGKIEMEALFNKFIEIKKTTTTN